MKKIRITAIVVITIITIFCVVMTSIKSNKNKDYVSDYQHEMENGVNTDTGTVTLPDDFHVDESFVTHLPLVVIDLKGNRIPNVYSFSSDGTKRVYSKEGLLNPDPWVSMNVKIIDNENGQNHINDEAVINNDGRIKLRGMTSRMMKRKLWVLRCRICR